FEQNIYTFNVDVSANKKEIKKAIFSLYKVKPTKVNILSIPYKNIISKGKKGVRGGGKKAVVYLKKEDKIEFI
ncbi:50S ribosomal protein L23, partial [Candidatus Nomurabacteria bacterium CG10_big_fil_rev_8_21_14_0_10_03_31_7]